ncbi:MAG: enoyl-[acyl-carrier-protein] reductase FabI [Proteobacteria bacterium]|nr:enoyl-[acyl-carrier-protein] reductase FabI [Pseudomonadota bacterium]
MATPLPATASAALPLAGKRALITGVANAQSIAYGCAKAFVALGGEVMLTYQNEKSLPYVQPLLAELGSPKLMPCDVRQPGALEAVFAQVEKQWGALDMALHSIAFAPKADLQGRVTDCTREGFLDAMDVSCHSFMRMARLAEPLMKNGGALFTMSYYGSEKVVDHYGIMGPVKAALEAATRYMAAELGPKRIRVNAISPGPLPTRAASGIKDFSELTQEVLEEAPTRSLTTIDEVGSTVAWLSVDAAGRSITGQVLYIDGGYHIMA